MGGGSGMMKAAAKAAGIGAINGGFRSIPSETSVRSAVKQIPAVFSSTGDDWEFADGAETPPRLVFGGAPTLQEAKEAALDLKEAIDKAYLSSPIVPGWGLSCISTTPVNTRIVDRVTNDGTPALPKNALKAFKFLSENSAAQTVVASIACDPNVWNAVLQNEALVEFLQSNALEEKSKSSTNFLFESTTKSSDYTEVLKKSVETIKFKVVNMMTSLSGYFNQLFAVPVEDRTLNNVEKDSGSVPFVDVAKLMGLVVMVIAIIFLKRG